MKVTSPDRPVFANINGHKIVYKPFVRYILSDWEFLSLVQLSPQTRWTHTSFNSYERRYGGQNLNGKKVCLYRHSAYGDQLMISAVPRYLKTLYPDVTIHMYCDPSVVDMWQANPFVECAALPIPIHFDVARAYDYHIFYEGMLENNGEYDQNNCYDDFFGVLGLKDVPTQFKRPHLIVRPEDYKAAKDLDLTGNYIVYHLAPANKNRCYPPDKGMDFVLKFLGLDGYANYRVILVGTTDGDFEKEVNVPKHDRILNLVNKTKSFRELIPIIERARLLVCPDSSVMHLAACFDHVPVISLWGLFHPHDRVAYYPNHHPLFKEGICTFAPCHNHDFDLPSESCKHAKDWNGKYCAVLSAITPEEILEKAKEIL